MARHTYELTFSGTASQTLVHVFEDCTVSSSNGVTVVRSTVADQPALRGLIDRIYGVGLDLVAIQRVNDDS
jgi:hypothetical protein